jgi:formylglycine-generating enzyme required for sulfatase activity
MQTELPDGARMEFVRIEPGSFLMGAPPADRCARGIEQPRTEVTLTQGFWLARYVVTQGQWEAVMGARPWADKEHVVQHPDHPAVYVSWDAVQEFVQTLNVASYEHYRLPSEAEWEYACRAGTRTRWSHGRDWMRLHRYAWCAHNTWDAGLRHAQPVGRKEPNPWGLCDMHGNVWEWCQDGLEAYPEEGRLDPRAAAEGPVRVYRGGSFYCSFTYARSSARGSHWSGYSHFDVGFRLARVEPEDVVALEVLAEVATGDEYWPPVQGGTPVKRFRFGEFEAVVVSGVQSLGGIQYLYVMSVYRLPEGELYLCVASEENALDEPQGRGRRAGSMAGSHFLGLFTGGRHLNLGLSDDWADLEKFTAKALDVARRHIGVLAKVKEVK